MLSNQIILSKLPVRAIPTVTKEYGLFSIQKINTWLVEHKLSLFIIYFFTAHLMPSRLINYTAIPNEAQKIT